MCLPCWQLAVAAVAIICQYSMFQQTERTPVVGLTLAEIQKLSGMPLNTGRIVRTPSQLTLHKLCCVFMGLLHKDMNALCLSVFHRQSKLTCDYTTKPYIASQWLFFGALTAV